MRIPLTPHGIPELLLFGALFGGAAVAAAVLVPAPLGAIVALLPLGSLAFILNFFRDPDRRPARDDAPVVIAPADGKVTDILRIEKAPFLNGPATRIGIFLSVFDVHVNRTPVMGKVAYLHHRPGEYLDARDPECADRNEAFDLGLEVDDGTGARFPVLIRQVAGLIARRIICKAKMGQDLRRGERYGMIKFGSRTEVYLPVDRVASVEVRIGDRVKGGMHAIATLKTPALVASGKKG